MLPAVQTAPRSPGVDEHADAPDAEDEGVGVPRGGDLPEGSTEGRRRSRLALVVLVALLAVPLAVALGVLHEPRWYPAGDHAQTELRVRDVGTENPPLTGLGGRIGVFGPDQGSHPGPLSFWTLSVPYRLLGASGWALQAATALLHLVAMGLTLWLARRRGGLALLVGTAVVLVVLAHAYGGYALTLPWNPYLPVLWWMTFLFGVWSLLCGDLPVAPVTVFAGSFCMQTHISYAGLVGALAALSAATAAYWIYVRRRDRPAFRRSMRWTALGVVVGAVVWFPRVPEQTTGSQGGNLGTIIEHFGDSPEETIGLGQGLELVLANLDPWHLLTEPVIEGQSFLGGPVLPGALLLAAWAAAVVVSWRLRHLTLLRLHGLLAVVVVLAVVSASRIFGPPWVYLALWTWGICASLVIAVGWSVAALAARVGPGRPRPRLATAGVVGAAVVLVALTARSTVDAAYTEEFQPELSASAAELVPETIEALEEGSAPGSGGDGPYLVSWEDPIYLGGRGFALFNELDREGFDVGMTRFFRAAVTRHRVVAPTEATAEIHVAVGPDIEGWRARPGFEEVAYHDPAGPAGRAEYERLRAEVTEELGAQGRSELTRLFEEAPAGFLSEEGLSDELLGRVERMIELGLPAAVFVGPPTGTDA